MLLADLRTVLMMRRLDGANAVAHRVRSYKCHCWARNLAWRGSTPSQRFRAMPVFRSARRSVFVLALAALASPASAAVYRVGTGSGCTHSSIQAAVDAAGNTTQADTIRITE